MSLYGHIISFFLDELQRMEWLDHMIGVSLSYFWECQSVFARCLYHCTPNQQCMGLAAGLHPCQHSQRSLFLTVALLIDIQWSLSVTLCIGVSTSFFSIATLVNGHNGSQAWDKSFHFHLYFACITILYSSWIFCRKYYRDNCRSGSIFFCFREVISNGGSSFHSNQGLRS